MSSSNNTSAETVIQYAIAALIYVGILDYSGRRVSNNYYLKALAASLVNAMITRGVAQKYIKVNNPTTLTELALNSLNNSIGFILVDAVMERRFQPLMSLVDSAGFTATAYGVDYIWDHST
jgi:hypothetical protein